MERVATDAAPGEAGDETRRVGLGEIAVVVEPVACADLDLADEAHGEQVGGGGGEAGVLGDDLGDHLGTLVGDPVDLLAHGGVVGQVGLEDEPEGAALVLEPSAGAALKTARKGVSNYEVVVRGRAAHAGLEPERGSNATVEMAFAVLALNALAQPLLGTTVTPTVLRSGTATNVVPAEAVLQVDVRTATPEEQRRVDIAARRLIATVPGTTIDVLGGPAYPVAGVYSVAAIAGLGGVALSQLGNVGPELGQSYIVDSFMVVVTGGVGKLAGTILAAAGRVHDLPLAVSGFAAAVFGGLASPVRTLVGGLVLGVAGQLTAGYLNGSYQTEIAMLLMLGSLEQRKKFAELFGA